MLKQSAQAAYSLRNFKVLLVEDYDFIRGLIVAMLKAFGVGNLVIATDSRQAIELLTVNISQSQHGSSRPIDIVLTDWMMPGGSGKDLIQWMRNHPHENIRFMPILMVSTFASEDVVIAARDLGINEVLVKPISAEKVASRILSIIDHPRPFVRATTFFGPDRRRKEKPIKGEDRRKMDPESIVSHHEEIIA